MKFMKSFGEKRSLEYKAFCKVLGNMQTEMWNSGYPVQWVVCQNYSERTLTTHPEGQK